jgi:hypothetical protein
MNLLDFTNTTHQVWNEQTSDKVRILKSHLQALVKNKDFINYLSSQNLEKGIVLHHDQQLGYYLFAYSEKKSTFRVPHNHGNGWVIYTVLSGIMEMATYFNTINDQEESMLVEKERFLMSTGDSRIFFPGDIHHTHSIEDGTTILRFTSIDLKLEEKQGRMKRFTNY